MRSSSTHKGIRDYRRLKWCPKCDSWSVEHPGQRHNLSVCTHMFKNWDEVWARDAERKLHIGPPPKKIDLETFSFRCFCTMCGWSAYYFADTGKRCDSRGRKMKKSRSRKKH